MTVIECENVSKSFQCGASWERLFSALEVRALDEVTFRSDYDVPLLIHGNAGSGKSVLLNLLAGFYPPDAGQVRIHGEDPWTDAGIRSRMAVVRPGPGDFDSSLSSRRNLRIVAGLYDLGPKEATSRVEEALDFVGIQSEEQTVPVGELSTGTQSLISLASALIASPDVLLLDEPDRFMDPPMFQRQQELIRGLVEQGIEVVLASPKVNDYEELTAARLFLDDGRSEVFREP
jgi:ABC-2 type transport system ATP-binding protein